MGMVNTIVDNLFRDTPLTSTTTNPTHTPVWPQHMLPRKPQNSGGRQPHNDDWRQAAREDNTWCDWWQAAGEDAASNGWKEPAGDDRWRVAGKDQWSNWGGGSKEPVGGDRWSAPGEDAASGAQADKAASSSRHTRSWRASAAEWRPDWQRTGSEGGAASTHPASSRRAAAAEAQPTSGQDAAAGENLASARHRG